MGETLILMQASEMVIYPNPSNGRFNIQSSESIETLNVFDLRGNLVLTSQRRPSFDISHLAKGTYIMQVQLTNGAIQTSKVVLK